jgi:hypothetical protein
VVGLLTEWVRGNQLETRRADDDKGGTMRLGAYDAVLTPGSRVAEAYGAPAIRERHRHRYEVNIGYRETLEADGLKLTGVSPDGVLPEIVEREDHPWFIGVQYHPELKSRPSRPTPCSPASSPRPRNRAGWFKRALTSAGQARGMISRAHPAIAAGAALLLGACASTPPAKPAIAVAVDPAVLACRQSVLEAREAQAAHDSRRSTRSRRPSPGVWCDASTNQSPSSSAFRSRPWRAPPPPWRTGA